MNGGVCLGQFVNSWYGSTSSRRLEKLGPHSNLVKTPTSKPNPKGLRRSTAVVRID